jgi:hypothetical protein
MSRRAKDEGGMDWIYLAENTDLWRFFVNTVMKLRVPKKKMLENS